MTTYVETNLIEARAGDQIQVGFSWLTIHEKRIADGRWQVTFTNGSTIIWPPASYPRVRGPIA